MEGSARLDYLLAEARRHDPDRYLCALFAPAERREPLLALTLLNHELARVPAVARQPMVGLIRYQWWRDAIGEAAAGAPRDQPVVEGLAAGLGRGWLAADDLVALVDAREPELDADPAAPAGPDALAAGLEATEGAAQELMLRCLGGTEGTERRAARLVGTVLGLVRVAGGTARGAAGRAVLLDRAADRLAEARRLVPRPARERLAAFLPGRLAAADIRELRAGRGAGSPGHEGGDSARSPLAVLGMGLASLTRRY